jgi:hypothetical protein
MTRALTRSHFPCSRLIRTLTDLSVLETDEPGAGFADRLSQWVGFADAIALCAVHSERAAPSVKSSQARAGIAEEFARTRLALENSIRMSCRPGAGKARLELPMPMAGASVKEASAYGPYRRFHAAQQRDLELSVRALRASLREQIAVDEPGLSQLVDLDQAMEAILGEREGKLLATVTSLLEKRFGQLFRSAQQAAAAAGQEDSPALWMKPGGWLLGFCQELETVLLAELDVRLQPALGLIEAWNNERTKLT